MSGRRSYGTGSLKPHVNGDGSESWYGRWYVEDLATGKPKQVRRKVGDKRRPGSTKGLTKTQAEKRMGELMAEDAPVDSAADSRTLSWAADTMLAAMVGSEPQTIDTYRRDFDNHLRDPLGDKPLTKLVREDYEGVVAAMLKGYGRKPSGYSPKTIQNVLRFASRIHNYGRGRDPQWCPTNPAEGVELPKVADGEDIVHLTQDEASKLLDAITPDGWIWGDWDALDDWALLDFALWLTATMAGLRQGECIALRRRDLKWLIAKISVRKNRTRKHGDRTPKSAASRRDVPLPDLLGVVLDALLKRSRFTADDARVFGNPDTGDPISPKAMDERLEAAAKLAGIQRVTFHGLRHTFGTQCARAGVPMRTLKEWMGHARISTTERYARFAKDQNEVAIIENAFAPLSHSLSYSEANHPELTGTIAA